MLMQAANRKRPSFRRQKRSMEFEQDHTNTVAERARAAGFDIISVRDALDMAESDDVMLVDTRPYEATTISMVKGSVTTEYFFTNRTKKFMDKEVVAMCYVGLTGVCDTLIQNKQMWEMMGLIPRNMKMCIVGVSFDEDVTLVDSYGDETSKVILVDDDKLSLLQKTGRMWAS